MYSFSLHKNLLYYFQKYISLLFRFDKSWKIATAAALIITCLFSFFFSNLAFAQSSTLAPDTGIIPGTAQCLQYAIVGGSSSVLQDNALQKGVICQPHNLVAPVKTTSNIPGATGDNINYDRDYRYGGAVGAVMFFAGSLSDYRPASTLDAVTYQANQAGITVHAQVQGFNQLAPITVLWGVFRNIALLLFVVVFLAIGFFILIQRKVGGQETVSLVSSITNATVAMIFIAFSYAIGGVIIDIFTNVANGVVATTFNGFINSQDILHQLNLQNSGVNILTLMSELTNVGVSQSAANLFGTALTGLSYPAGAVKGIFNNLNSGLLGNAIGFFASGFIDILMGIIQNAFNNSSIINAVVAFIIFIVMLRVVFALLGAYVSIVFKIMFAPFILLPAALPGNAGKAILGWVLSLISHALVFPGIFACILLSAMFLNLKADLSTTASADCKYVSQLNPGNDSTIQGNSQAAKYFVVTRLGNGKTGDANSENAQCYPVALPPKFNYWPAPLGYINGVEPDDLIRFVIAFAFIVLTPNIPKVLQQLLKIPQDSLLGGVTQGLKSGAGAFSGFISAVPSLGIGRALGSITRSAADNVQ